MSAIQSAEPDTHEMVIVHRVFRREFHLLPDLISRVEVGNTQRAAVLAEHLTDIVAALHHHHENEDELLWPPLLERATPQTELVLRMEAQHTALGVSLDEIDKLSPAWVTAANAADRDELTKAVRQASVILDEHMGEEEQEILPLIRKHITVEEWSKVGKRGADSIQDKRKRMLFLGAILEETTPEEERTFLSNLPAPIRVLWKVLGRRQYAAYLRLIRSA